MKWYGASGNYTTEINAASQNVLNNHGTTELCDWHELAAAGLITSRDEYIKAVRAVSVQLAELGIAEAFSKKDAALLQMVRMLDEMDEVINLLTERITEWHSSLSPEFTKKYKRSNPEKLLQLLSRSDNQPIRRSAREIISLNNTRNSLMKDVSKKADEVIPNMSALVGGLVAARIISRAGGLDAAANMPASSIQVIGAESALFSHIRTGSSSPKHGIIYQHRRVHNAPKELRGKTARVLAGKLAIAARLDLYRGEAAADFIEDANYKIDIAAGIKK